MRKFWAGGAALSVLAALGIPAGITGHFDSSRSSDETIEAVLAATPELEAETVDASVNRVFQEVALDNGQSRATIDIGSTGELTLESISDPAKEFSLTFLDPLGDSTLDPRVHGNIVEYSQDDRYSSVPVIREDGSVQAHTVIHSPSAPTEYTYSLDIPAGATVERAGESLLILDERGGMIGGVAPAWAKDANGDDVPTYYEIDGTTLTQVVHHETTSSYPVVADPWMGINLFGHVYKDTYRNQPRVNANLSPWGWAVYSGAATGINLTRGQIILHTNGLAEVLSRGQDIRDAFRGRKSMYQQYSCHALGALLAGEWNLERSRPTLTVPWTKDVLKHHCNWNFPDGRV